MIAPPDGMGRVRVTVRYVEGLRVRGGLVRSVNVDSVIHVAADPLPLLSSVFHVFDGCVRSLRERNVETNNVILVLRRFTFTK